MRRILGLDTNGVWHITSSTYTTTMHTKCDKWLKVALFAIEGTMTEGGRQDEQQPHCVTCAFVSNLHAPLAPR